MGKARQRTTWGGVAVVLLALLLQYLGVLPLEGTGVSTAPPPAPGEFERPRGESARGEPLVERLIRERRSGVMVDVDAVVLKTLRDDNEGSRHQRFLIELDSGNTLLVAHNIDLAPRVPLRRGDDVRVYGQYEWNDKGGVLHWTHHDPRGRHEEGFIEYEGRRYE